MKKECNIVRDLMVLYELENCSKESIQMIKEHVENCEECRKIWESKSGEEIEQAIEEIKKENEEFDKLRKKIRRKNILKIIVIAIALSFVMYKGYQVLSRPLVCELEDMEFSNFYKDNGEIGFKVTLTDGKGFGEHSGYYAGSSLLGENAMELEIYRSRFSRKTTQESEISMYVSLPGDLEEIYYADKDGEVLIWQEGDPISELTDEIQEDMDKLESGNNY